jgi:hypothetical protein
MGGPGARAVFLWVVVGSGAWFARGIRAVWGSDGSGEAREGLGIVDKCRVVDVSRSCRLGVVRGHDG